MEHGKISLPFDLRNEHACQIAPLVLVLAVMADPRHPVLTVKLLCLVEINHQRWSYANTSAATNGPTR